MFQPKHLLALTSFTLFTTLPLAAQNEQPTHPERKKPLQVAEQPQGQQRAMGGDAVLATWLQVESNNEVALARFALGKTQNAEVKAFAQQMVEDHDAFSKALQPFVDTEVTDSQRVDGKTRGEKDRDRDAEGSDKSNGKQAQPQDASGVRQAPPMAHFDHTALIRDLGKKCQESAMKALEAKTGVEFDQCFLRMQVAGHEKTTGALQVFRSYGSERLTPVLDRGQKTIAAHLEHARTLCKKVEAAPKGEVGGNAAPR